MISVIDIVSIREFEGQNIIVEQMRERRVTDPSPTCARGVGKVQLSSCVCGFILQQWE